MKLYEYKLYEPIKKLFESQGYCVYAEIPFINSHVDVVAIKDDIIIAIEMKMSLTKKVIQQSYTHNLFANYRYVAIATNPIKIERCTKYGIGIIQIKNNNAIILIESQKNDNFYGNYRNIFLKKCMAYKNNNIAGLPNLKGIGPKIDCKKRVIDYIKNNPNASWQEIYKNVYNHYCNYKSMRSALKGLNK